MMWLGAWSINFVWVLYVLALTHAAPIALIWGFYLFGDLHPADARLLTGAVVRVVNWIGSAFLVAGLLWMAYQSNRKRLIHPAYTWIAAVLWLAYSAAFILYAVEWEVIPTAKDWVIRFPHPVQWSIWLGISALPITPLFLQPLLLDRVRHQ